jgi:hypothetical protein
MTNRATPSYTTWIAIAFLVFGVGALLTVHDLPTSGAFLSAGAALLTIGNNPAAWSTFPAWRRAIAITLLAGATLCVVAQFATIWK